MFISVIELFKIGIGPSSSHTMGPMIAAHQFLSLVDEYCSQHECNSIQVRCILKGSLAFTGKGHNTDRAVTLGLHSHLPDSLSGMDIDKLVDDLWQQSFLTTEKQHRITFSPAKDIVFDYGEPLAEHPNGMVFELLDSQNKLLLSEVYFSIGGGFISTQAEIADVVAPVRMHPSLLSAYPFDSAAMMLEMAEKSGYSIARMKRINECKRMSAAQLDDGMDAIWFAMQNCVEEGLKAQGTLPGGLSIQRRANALFQQLDDSSDCNINDWLCAYAMAVNEENAAGHRVVTAPTNGAAGVIPAVLYYFVHHENGTLEQVHDFLLTAAAIGGIIKHRSSISGAEVGCQGEVGSAASMAAAGLCAVKGGTPQQVENAAEIALEHHLGMTCDPVNGLVQVPCIERNGFGAIKAYTAASLALRGSGEHFMPLDNCIAAMRQTGLDMSAKYKETSLGGLAVNVTEC
jgi:L-serine dehydratase